MDSSILKAWWVIEGQAIMDMLKRVSDGESPGIVYTEYYANCEKEDFTDYGKLDLD